MRTRYSKWAGLCAPLMFSLVACLGDATTVSDDLGEESEALSVPAPSLPTVVEFQDPLLESYAKTPQSILVHSRAEYSALFGHEPPLAGDEFVFYSAGILPTGGYDASFSYVRPVPIVAPTLPRLPRPEAIVGTVLDVPGPECAVTLERRPVYAVGVLRGAHYQRVQFDARKRLVDCVGCQETECGPGEHCELEDVVCVKAPCYPVPECVADPEPPAPTCADHECPEGSHCELQNVVCVKAPCYPIPECVSDEEPPAPPQPPSCVPHPCPIGKMCPILDCYPIERDPCKGEWDSLCAEKGMHCEAPADRPICVR